MLTITQRAVKFGIKNGYGFTQFCEKFQCNQEELEHAVRSVFGTRGGASALKDIQNNTKKIDKTTKKSCKSGSGMRALEESHPTPPEECSEAKPLTLTELKTHEATLSDIVVKLESEHKSLISQHHSNLQQLHQLRKQLAETRQQFEQISQQYEALILKNNDLVNQINSITDERRNELEELQDIRHQIQRLETVTICICDDDSIEIFDGPNIELNDTGHEELYLSLLTQASSLCQDLRLRDLKTIARVKSIIANSDHPLELLFENNDLETHYAKFI